MAVHSFACKYQLEFVFMGIVGMGFGLGFFCWLVFFRGGHGDGESF